MDGFEELKKQALIHINSVDVVEFVVWFVFASKIVDFLSFGATTDANEVLIVEGC